MLNIISQVLEAELADSCSILHLGGRSTGGGEFIVEVESWTEIPYKY